MRLLHTAEHQRPSFTRSVPENNILTREDVSQHQKIHAKAFSPSLKTPPQSTHPCWEANVILSASKPPLPMWPKMSQQHNDSDTIWGTEGLFFLIKTAITLILHYAFLICTLTPLLQAQYFGDEFLFIFWDFFSPCAKHLENLLQQDIWFFTNLHLFTRQ